MSDSLTPNATKMLHRFSRGLERSLVNLTGLTQEHAQSTIDAALRGKPTAVAQLAEALDEVELDGRRGSLGWPKSKHALGMLQRLAGLKTPLPEQPPAPSSTEAPMSTDESAAAAA